MTLRFTNVGPFPAITRYTFGPGWSIDQPVIMSGVDDFLRNAVLLAEGDTWVRVERGVPQIRTTVREV